MTTHEAIAIQPNTPVHWLPPKDYAKGDYPGLATLNGPDLLRIVWDDFAEADTVLRTCDRRALAAFPITEMAAEDLIMQK